jgi:hypothetical protein
MSRPPAWREIEKRMEVVIEPFSSKQDPPEEGTDINVALLDAAEKHPHLTAAVLLSDGDWNSGQPPAQAATRLRMRDVPVFVVPLGAETRLPDVELKSFDVPTFAIAGKPLRVPFTIESSLPRDEAATVEMKSSNGEVVTKSIVIPAMGRITDAIAWKPDKPGEMTLTLTVPRRRRITSSHLARLRPRNHDNPRIPISTMIGTNISSEIMFEERRVVQSIQ